MLVFRSHLPVLRDWEFDSDSFAAKVGWIIHLPVKANLLQTIILLDEIRHIDFALNFSRFARFSCIVRQCDNLQFSDCQVDRNAILGREEILILGLKKSRSEVRLYFRLTSITIEKTFWPPSAFSIILVTSLPHIG